MNKPRNEHYAISVPRATKGSDGEPLCVRYVALTPEDIDGIDEDEYLDYPLVGRIPVGRRKS